MDMHINLQFLLTVLEILLKYILHLEFGYCLRMVERNFFAHLFLSLS